MTGQYAKRGESRGFTLLEVLVAITVASVGVTVFISLFGSSLALAQSNRYQIVATQLANECLQAVTNTPERYSWPLGQAAPGTLVGVSPLGESANARHPVPVPAISPGIPLARQRNEGLYKRFSWQAYAQLPKPDAGYVEVTAVVRWDESGHERSFTLTSLVPRAAIPFKTEAPK